MRQGLLTPASLGSPEMHCRFVNPSSCPDCLKKKCYPTPHSLTSHFARRFARHSGARADMAIGIPMGIRKPYSAPPEPDQWPLHALNSM